MIQTELYTATKFILLHVKITAQLMILLKNQSKLCKNIPKCYVL